MAGNQGSKLGEKEIAQKQQQKGSPPSFHQREYHYHCTTVYSTVYNDKVAVEISSRSWEGGREGRLCSLYMVRHLLVPNLLVPRLLRMELMKNVRSC